MYFSYSYPYTFSTLQQFIKEASLNQKDFLGESVLCKSLSGVEIPILTITSRLHSDPDQYNLVKMDDFQDFES